MKIVFTKQFEKSFIRLFSCNPIYAVPRAICNAKIAVKHAWQRVFRGFDDSWYWGLDEKLSEVIPQCVRMIRTKGTGHPAQIKANEWKVILKKIEIGFKEYPRMQNCRYNSKLYKIKEKKFIEGKKLFFKWFPNLWD